MASSRLWVVGAAHLGILLLAGLDADIQPRSLLRIILLMAGLNANGGRIGWGYSVAPSTVDHTANGRIQCERWLDWMRIFSRAVHCGSSFGNLPFEVFRAEKGPVC